MKKPCIVMQSDFGIDSALVSCMYGIVKKVDKDLEIYKLRDKSRQLLNNYPNN